MINSSKTQKDYIARINKVIHYITENFSDNINLKILADIACFSPFHFHRVFNAIVGETPNEFINRVRLDRAALILLFHNENSISDVAYRCGFSSQSVFARAFKEKFGMSATEWITSKSKEISDLNENSKICKTVSKNRQQIDLEDDYFRSELNYELSESIIEGINMNVEIKQLNDLHVSFITVTDGYGSQAISQAYEDLCKWGGPRGLLNENTSFLGIGLDSPEITPIKKCRYYACITTPENVVTPPEINNMHIPGGTFAVVRFEGSGKELQTTYRQIYYDEIPNKGYVPDDKIPYEIYYGSPKEVYSDIENKMILTFIMDICIPVKPA